MVTRASLAALCLAACGAPAPSPPTGGVSIEAGPTGRGLALVMSDYQSTNVALLGCDGRTLSASFLSSASAQPGLSAPLSGDVVLPGEPQRGDELALLDRYPSSIVTLVDVTTGSVAAQLDVGSAFRANPQDLVRFGDELWVTRYESNLAMNASPLDRGGDVAIVSRAARAVVERIDLTEAIEDAPGFLPRPGRMVLDDGRLHVLLAAYNATFSDAADSRIVTIDIASRHILRTHVLEGLAGCSSLAIEPPSIQPDEGSTPRRLLVGCSGRFLGSSQPTLSSSGLVLLEVLSDGVAEVRRWGSDALAGRPVGFDVALDETGRALVTTLGRLGEGETSALPDALVELELESGASRIVLETQLRPFELGGVRCNTRLDGVPLADGVGACRPDCFVADGERGVLHRLVLGASGYEPAEALTVEGTIGLPPRWLGRF
ncbi:MAG: hypothetical protein FJ095_02730 [Deltaproteobacteria bacterium]|nr:hypothetical protein [Deltaproteobacteria bacterium]